MTDVITAGFSMRRLVTTVAAGVLAAGLVAGCSSGTDDAIKKATNGKVKVDGKKVTVTDGDNSISVGTAELPDSFPSDDVPRPDDATLKAVVSGKQKGDEYYSLTYTVSGATLQKAANDYKAKLQDRDYRIEASSSAGASTAGFSAFTARGKDWDVVVYAGGNGNDGAMSLQVTPHDASTDPTDAGDTGGATTG
jgi:hypothetical protein